MTIDVGSSVAVCGGIMAMLSGIALTGAARRGVGVFLACLVMVGAVWAYWIGSYADLLTGWFA